MSNLQDTHLTDDCMATESTILWHETRTLIVTMKSYSFLDCLEKSVFLQFEQDWQCLNL